MTDERRRRLRQRLRRITRPAFLGTLRRTAPLSESWGEDRGRPVDRYYIERFLEDHSTDIRGRVLEVKDPAYTRRFGKSVLQSEVVDVAVDNPYATLVTDLQSADAIRSNAFDCFILTQTLQYLYDVRAAIRHAHRILQPGGVLLGTVPAVSRASVADDRSPDLWRFTATACTRLFTEVFAERQVQVTSYGNVLTCISFLAGLADAELTRAELDFRDERFPLVITVRAVK